MLNVEMPCGKGMLLVGRKANEASIEFGQPRIVIRRYPRDDEP
jgi:hypothetical protein